MVLIFTSYRRDTTFDNLQGSVRTASPFSSGHPLLLFIMYIDWELFITHTELKTRTHSGDEDLFFCQVSLSHEQPHTIPLLPPNEE